MKFRKTFFKKLIHILSDFLSVIPCSFRKLTILLLIILEKNGMKITAEIKLDCQRLKNNLFYSHDRIFPCKFSNAACELEKCARNF